MKNSKKILAGVVSFFALTLASCGGTGGNVLSEQYFEQPTISEHCMTVELLHKEESKWLDVVKQKATSVGITASEYGAGKKDVKESFDVALRYSDVYADDGSYKSSVQTLVDEYDLKYLVSDYYVAPDDEDDTSKVESSIVEAAKEDESVEPKSEETNSEEEPKEEGSDGVSSEKTPDISSSEETPAESSDVEADDDIDPAFPISYGTKDALAAKFSFDASKVLDKVKGESSLLFSMKVALQKYENKIALLGSSTYVLSYVDGTIAYAPKVTLVFDGEYDEMHLALGKTLKDVAAYSGVLESMLGVDAKFGISYKDSEGQVDVDLEKTVFVDCEDESLVPEGAFNVHGKSELVVKIKTK